MKKILLFMGALWGTIFSVWADEPLKKPLVFVPSDSIVVWGEDRSDFRTTALSVAPELVDRPVQVERIERKALKKAVKAWDKELIPNLNLAGAIPDEQGRISVLPTVEVIQKGGWLFLQTAEAHYMNVIERCALNALMAVATPGQLTFDKHVAAQALINVSGMGYATDDQGIFVNLYMNSSTHIETEQLDCIVEQLTAMPHAGRVKLRIGGLKRGLRTFKLRLRMPDWACGRLPEDCHYLLEGTPEQCPKVYVNGREDFYTMENGYLVIDRRWNSGDEVYFDFPFHVQYLYPQTAHGEKAAVVALQRGPLVYGFKKPTEDFRYEEQTKVEEADTPNREGHSVVTVPVREVSGEKSVRSAEPVMDGAYFLWMNVMDKVH